MRRFLSLLVIAIASTPVVAQTTYTWTGAGNGAWATAANWDFNGVPANDLLLSDVVFAGNSSLVSTVNVVPTPYSIHSLMFDGSAGTFNLVPAGTPTTLRLGNGGIMVNSPVAQTIGNPLALGASQTWFANSAPLFIDGTVNATGQTLTFDGAFDVRLSQSATVTGGALVKNGLANVALAGNNTPTSVDINSGTLIVNKVGTGSPIGSGPVNLNGGTLSFRVNGAPVSTSGYNHDVITALSEFTGPPYGTTRGVDGNNGNGQWVYFQQGAYNPNLTYGLPANGRFNALAVDYQFQDYVGNNVLSLTNSAGVNPSGTLTLDTPGQFRSLNIMNVTGSGSAQYSFTLNFDDATTTTVTGNVSRDWFNGPANETVFIVGARLSRTAALPGTFDQPFGTNPRIYTTNYTLNAADRLKTLNSITFNTTNGTATTGLYTFNVFGISGIAGSDTQVYTNPVNVLTDSTIEQLNVANVTAGPLSIGFNTLTTVTSGATTTNFGATTLVGDPNFNLGLASTLNLGAVNDGAIPRTITNTGPGVLGFAATATSFNNAFINVNAGGIAASAANALGTSATVTMLAGTTFNISANTTIAAVTGAGAITQTPTSTLTINGGTGNTFAGRIGGGPLVINGAFTNLTLNAGPNTIVSSSIQNAGKLSVASPGSLGSGPVALNTTSTLSVGGVTSINGFNNGFGFNLQTNGGNDPNFPFVPTINGNELNITSAAGGIAASAWFGTPVPTGAFTASFKYYNSAPGADGITFTLQSESATALGIPGGGLGYAGGPVTGVSPSYALAFNIFNGGVLGYAFTADGVQPAAYNAVTPVNVAGAQLGNEITFDLAYDGANLNVTLTQGANMFVVPAIPIDLSTLGVGAFVGFTGGTGVVTSQQFISDFLFNSSAGLNYGNNVTVAAASNANLNVQLMGSALDFNFGTLTSNAGATLNVTPEAGSIPDTPYSVNFGTTTVNNSTFNIENNGTGRGTVRVTDLTGTGPLTKNGSGTLVLRGTGTYTGLTTVTNGRLTFNGDYSGATGATSVASGAFLAGGGSKGGTVSVLPLATVETGDGTPANPTLTVTAANFSDTAVLKSDLRNGGVLVDTATTGGSRLATTTFGRDLPTGTISLLLSSDGSIGSSGPSTYTRTVATYTNLNNLAAGTYTLGGPFAVSGENFTVLPGWQVDVNGGNVNVTFSVVPEPMALLAVGAFALAMGRRRLRVRG